MFNIRNERGVDIKVWLERSMQIEDTTLEEAFAIADLPFAKSHIALMADCHATGFKMPVGGVIATEDVIIPAAVSSDIGCGVAFKQTNLPIEVLDVKTGSGSLAQQLVGSIMRDLPTGFEHKDPELNKDNMRILNAIHDFDGGPGAIENTPLEDAVKESFEVVGTLGGGNHFLELQENKDGKLGIMLHTGSRNVGAKVNKHFSNLAKKLNKKWYVDVLSDNVNLPFLPLYSEEGQDYLKWMNFALEIAEINREEIMKLAEKKLLKSITKYTDFDGYDVETDVNVHHNYAAYENIDRKNYMVHRKGAVRARKGEIIPIPGSMSTYSYICEGLGNEDSFKSCSHGAGRTHTRTAAREEFTVQEVIEDLKANNIVLGKENKQDITEEYKGAYKDIHNVIDQQSDLIKPIDKMKTRAVIKG